MSAAEPLGHRVVVRRFVDGGLADVVGVLVDAGPDVLVVRRRDGSLVEMSRSAVNVMRTVAAAPRDVLALEEVAAQGWPAPETRWLGRWLLRAAAGWTGRGNSVLPLGEPGLPLDQALADVTAWYGERGLPARFTIPTPARELLDGALAQRGWRSYNPTAVLTGDVGVLLRRLPVSEHAVLVEPAPSADWLSLYHYRGGAELPPVARTVLAGAREPGFAVLRDRGGTPLAIARGSVDEGWLGVTAVEVDAGHRRQGLATAVMRALLAWAAERAATSTYLQVAEENTGALALYDRLGYLRHHGYHYVVAPS
ncbi:MAG TPA: GNAT family N-acetyltransferase [Mycobacteriales bacterium]|nr:GNAT family N-acetyltransferase [Mycobacteriales bacterium]